jgi:hypothetical protein
MFSFNLLYCENLLSEIDKPGGLNIQDLSNLSYISNLSNLSNLSVDDYLSRSYYHLGKFSYDKK